MLSGRTRDSLVYLMFLASLSSVPRHLGRVLEKLISRSLVLLNCINGWVAPQVRDSNSDAWILFDDEKVQLIRRGGSSKKDSSASVGVSVGAGKNSNSAGNGAGSSAGSSPANAAGNNSGGPGCERKPKGGGKAGQAGGGGKRTKSTSKRKGQSAKAGGAAGESDAEVKRRGSCTQEV